MSSWLSLFKPDDDNDQARPESPNPSASGGVRDDLSALSQTLSHHLRGVAAFLAPPPGINSNEVKDPGPLSSSQAISGIKNDLAEIEETVKSSLSMLSTKFTSSFSHFSNDNNRENNGKSGEVNSEADDDDEDEEEEEEYDYEYDEDDDVAGIDDEIVEFVRELSSRSEIWTDFPINLPEDYVMSDIQQEHAASIEHLVPSLLTLRQKICSNMSNGKFWMIYFTILLPRLSENDLQHLSTPEIVEVRETLMRTLQKERNTVVEASDNPERVMTKEVAISDSGEADESLVQQIIPAETSGTSLEAETADNQKPDQWLEDEDAHSTASVHTQRLTKNDEDISFSDLEDDDKDLSNRLSGLRIGQSNMIASVGESGEWFQLNENSIAQAGRQKAGQSGFREKDSEGEESNEWHHVDDVDLESLASA